MKILVLGATGYIGGTVAARLLAAGHRVTGLARTAQGADGLRARGVEPLVGTLGDTALLAEAARAADAVVNAATSDERAPVEAVLGALAGSGKPFLHTSGSSIVATDAAGEPTDAVYDEDTPLAPVPDKVARVALDRRVTDAAREGVGAVVLCPTLVYGRGLGVHEESMQVPALAAQARASGVARYIGRGENVWSNVHVEDLADLYLLALERTPGGTFLFAENGEASMRSVVEAVARRLGVPAESWSIEEAVRCWGPEMARLGLGSNSRVRAKRARALLGWNPRRASLLRTIAEE